MNAIILWNTLSMDRALAALRQAGVAVQPEDVTRLSPLGFKHVNLIGRYQFALRERSRSPGEAPYSVSRTAASLRCCVP